MHFDKNLVSWKSSSKFIFCWGFDTLMEIFFDKAWDFNSGALCCNVEPMKIQVVRMIIIKMLIDNDADGNQGCSSGEEDSPLRRPVALRQGAMARWKLTTSYILWQSSSFHYSFMALLWQCGWVNVLTTTTRVIPNECFWQMYSLAKLWHTWRLIECTINSTDPYFLCFAFLKIKDRARSNV